MVGSAPPSCLLSCACAAIRGSCHQLQAVSRSIPTSIIIDQIPPTLQHHSVGQIIPPYPHPFHQRLVRTIALHDDTNRNQFLSIGLVLSPPGSIPITVPGKIAVSSFQARCAYLRIGSLRSAMLPPNPRLPVTNPNLDLETTVRFLRILALCKKASDHCDCRICILLCIYITPLMCVLCTACVVVVHAASQFQPTAQKTLLKKENHLKTQRCHIANNANVSGIKVTPPTPRRTTSSATTERAKSLACAIFR